MSDIRNASTVPALSIIVGASELEPGMLTTKNIQQIPTDLPSVYAFRIDGGVSIEEMAEMAEVMNVAFEHQEAVNILVILHDFKVSDAASGLSLRSLKSQIRSLTHVKRYAVVGAPSFAAAMIETFDKISPIEAETFDPAEEAAAWNFVDAQPVL